MLCLEGMEGGQEEREKRGVRERERRKAGGKERMIYDGESGEGEKERGPQSEIEKTGTGSEDIRRRGREGERNRG